MAKWSLAQALDKVLAQTKEDGTPQFGIGDVHAARTILLIEVGRAGQGDKLSLDQKKELFYTLQAMGIDEHTDPALMMGLATDYFKQLNTNPELFRELDKLFHKFAKKGDRVEAVATAEKAYEKLTEKDAAAAPMVGEEAPKDSEQAQTLALNLGNKVRI